MELLTYDPLADYEDNPRRPKRRGAISKSRARSRSKSWGTRVKVPSRARPKAAHTRNPAKGRRKKSRKNPRGKAGSGKTYRPTFTRKKRGKSYSFTRKGASRKPKGYTGNRRRYKTNPSRGARAKQTFKLSIPNITSKNAGGVVAGGLLGWFGPGIAGYVVNHVTELALANSNASPATKEAITDGARIFTKAVLGAPIIKWTTGYFDSEAGKAATWLWSANLFLDVVFTGIKWLTAGGDSPGGVIPVRTGAGTTALTISGLGHVVKAPVAQPWVVPVVEERDGWGGTKYRVKNGATGETLFSGNQSQTDDYLKNYGYAPVQLSGYVQAVS